MDCSIGQIFQGSTSKSAKISSLKKFRVYSIPFNKHLFFKHPEDKVIMQTIYLRKYAIKSKQTKNLEVSRD